MRFSRLRRIAAIALTYRQLDAGSDLNVDLTPHIYKAVGSQIRLGDRVVLTSSSQNNSLGVGPRLVLRTMSQNAVIEIGDDTGISGGIISAFKRVTIGRRVLIGADCLITDSDHHAIHVLPRRYERVDQSTAKNVVIEDDVFIGTKSIVLKGVTIGRGTVIGAGSVVTSSIPAAVIAAGNPCKVLRPLNVAGGPSDD